MIRGCAGRDGKDRRVRDLPTHAHEASFASISSAPCQHLVRHFLPALARVGGSFYEESVIARRFGFTDYVYYIRLV